MALLFCMISGVAFCMCITLIKSPMSLLASLAAPEGKGAKRVGGAGARAGELSEGGYVIGGLVCR